MNILIALPNDSLGGAEQYLKMVAHHYLKLGANVFVLFLKRKNDLGWEDLEAYSNVTLFYTQSKTERAGLIDFFKNLSSLRRYKFDFIFTSHVHLTGLLGFFVRIRLLHKKYFVGRESTSIFHRFIGAKLLLFKIQYAIGYSSLDLLICQTDFMKKQLVESLPYLEKNIKIVTMPNPIDLENLKQVGDQDIIDQIKNRFGDYIITAGRLIQEKGFDLLISSFVNIKKENEDLKLVILGEGVQREMLMSLIKSYNLENDVLLPGFTKNVYPYFKQARLCVVSSRIEGFPNVLLQMMSQNNTIVSTLCAGGIDKLEGVITAKANDYNSLEEAIKTALKANTTENRLIFDRQLEARSIDKFIEEIEFNCLKVYH